MNNTLKVYRTVIAMAGDTPASKILLVHLRRGWGFYCKSAVSVMQPHLTCQ